MRGTVTVASLGLAGLIWALSWGVARGQPPTGEQSEEHRRERAIELFEQSEERYTEGEFRQAAELLERALELYEDPTLLFNLARARENEGELEAAIDAYERYIEAKPDAIDRGAIEQRIARIRDEIAEREELQRERTQAMRAQREAEERLEEAESISRGPLPWIVTGLGVAGLGNGVVFGVLSRSRHQDAVDDPTQTGAATSQSDARTFAKVATWSFVTGGVVAGAGVIWAIVGLVQAAGEAEEDAAPSSEAASVHPVFTPNGAGLQVAF